MNQSRPRFLLLFLLLIASSLSGQSDRQTTLPPLYEPEPVFDKIESQSLYLTMRDGAQIAIDIYLPKDRPPGKRLPTILHLTRYWRAIDLRWPFQGMMDIGPPSLYGYGSTKAMVQQGYALVSVDVRGTGASTGKRTMELSPDEAEDGREILDWIVDQPWSDGKVGAIGISYNGWTTLMLATLKHPALKAIIPMHAFFDGYREMSFIGGIPHEALTDDWTDICQTMDGGHIAGRIRGSKIALQGFPMVNSKHVARDRKAICEAHLAANGYAGDFMDKLEFREDEVAEFPGLTLDKLFPVSYVREIQASNVAIYAMSGWYDMSGTKGATRQFLNFPGGRPKLLFGAWNHGGRKLVSPFNPGVSEFERFSEFMKFFDYHLKGIQNGLYEEPRVHYYHMGEETWKTADTWPPTGVEMQTHYFGADSSLTQSPPASPSAFDLFTLDTSTHVGFNTRFELDSRNPTHYDTFLTQVNGLLSYAGPIAEEALDITGVPEVHLWLASEEEDGSVFAYLLDEDPNGKLAVMSQGCLRLLHRAESPEDAPYRDAVPYRSFSKADAASMPIGVPAEVHFGLTPISWQLQPGHRVRLVLAGSDRSHFPLIAEAPFIARLMRTQTQPSRLMLPVLR